MSDGTYQAVVYSQPVHELVDGVWVEIESTNPNARGDVTTDSTKSNIIDNYVLQGYGVQNKSLDRLYIGNRSSGLTQAYIQFAAMPTIPAGATITAATMTLHFTSGTNTAANASAYQVTGGEWASGTIQWSNKPAADVLLQSNISHNNVTGYVFSCLTAVRHWYDGDTTGQNENYGIMLRYYNESVADYNAVYSADYSDATKRPSIKITYWPANSTMDVDKGATLPLSVSGATGTVTWTSSNTSVATVNSSGVVTGIQVGTATITAYVGGAEYKTFTVNVTVADGVYYIKYAGLCLGTTGRVFDNLSVSLYAKVTSGSTRLRQLWKITYLGNGYYSIRPMYRLTMGLHAISNMVDITSVSVIDSLDEIRSINRWKIDYCTDGYMFLQAGITSRTMRAEQPYLGALISTAEYEEYSSGFGWELEKATDVEDQLILIDTQTGTHKERMSVVASYGARLTLADLNIAVSFVSENTNLQEIVISTSNPDNVQYDVAKGKIIGINKGTEGGLVASHTPIEGGYLFNKEITISVSETPYLPPLKPQEQSNWCWAASAQMLALDYEPTITATQSNAVYHIFGNTANEKGSNVQIAQAAEFFLESVGNEMDIGNTEEGTIITRESLIRFLDAGHSVVIKRGVYMGDDVTGLRFQGHASLICSYAVIEGEYQFFILDPLPVNIGTAKWMAYEEIRSNKDEDNFRWFWDGIIAAYIGSYGTLTPIINTNNDHT